MQVALTVPLVVRRIWPSAVFGWLFVVSAVAGLWNVGLVVSFALLVALYTVAAHASPGAVALVAAGLLEGGVIAAVISLAGSSWWHGAILGSGMVAAALGLGLYSATRRAYLKELHDRAERAGTGARSAEGTGRGRRTRPHHPRDARHRRPPPRGHDRAQRRCRRRIGRLIPAGGRRPCGPSRPPDARPWPTPGGCSADRRPRPGQDSEREPLPDLSGLDALVARVRAAGLPVSYELQGAPAPLSAGVQLTVYRLVQEALTNTLKHAGAGASAVVRLAYLPGEVRLDVEDDGAGASALQPRTAGRGLAGMRQRVQTFGGEVQAGPRSPAGWRVSARLRLDQEIPA